MYYLLYFVCHPQEFRFDIWAHSTWPAECRWVWCAAHTEEAGQSEICLSEDCGPADLHEENRTQQQKQERPRGAEGSLARVRPSAAAWLVLAPRLLAQQAGVCWRTLTTDVVHTHAAVLATQKFVVAHSGCGIERKRVSRRQTPTHTHTYRLHPNKYEHFYDYIELYPEISYIHLLLKIDRNSQYKVQAKY